MVGNTVDANQFTLFILCQSMNICIELSLMLRGNGGHAPFRSKNNMICKSCLTHSIVC